MIIRQNGYFLHAADTVDCRLVAQITQSSIGNPDPKTSSDFSSGQSTCGYFFRLISDVDGCDAHRICSPRCQMVVFFRSKELHGRQSQVRPSQISRLLAVVCVRESAISECRVFGSRPFIRRSAEHPVFLLEKL